MKVRKGSVEGYADGQYLTRIEEGPEETEEPPPEAPYCVVISGLNAEQAFNIADEYRALGYAVEARLTGVGT